MSKSYSAIVVFLMLNFLIGCAGQEHKPKPYKWNLYLHKKYDEFGRRITPEPSNEMLAKEGCEISRKFFVENEFYKAKGAAEETLDLEGLTKEQRFFLLKLVADSLVFLRNHGHQESLTAPLPYFRLNEINGPVYQGWDDDHKKYLDKIITLMESEDIHCDRFRMYSQYAALAVHAIDKKSAIHWKNRAIAEYTRITNLKLDENCGLGFAPSGIPDYCLDRVKASKNAYLDPGAVALFLGDVLAPCTALNAKQDIRQVIKIWQKAGCFMPLSRDAIGIIIQNFPSEERNSFPKKLIVNSGDYNFVHDALLRKGWVEEAAQFERDSMSQSRSSDSFDTMIASSKELMEGALRRNDIDTADSVLMSLLDKFEQYRTKDAEHAKKVADAIQYFKNDVNKYNKSFYANSRVRLENMK